MRLHFDKHDRTAAMKAICAGAPPLRRRPEWSRPVWWKVALQRDARGTSLVRRWFEIRRQA